MADNDPKASSAGTLSVATDDIGGIHFQRVKVTWGVDGTATDASATNPLPTSQQDPSATTAFGPITAINTVLFAAQDTANRQSIHLQLSGLWDGGIALQASQDGTTWFACRAQSVNSDLTVVDTIYAPDQFVVPVVARFFRAITNPDFSGSVSGTYTLRFAEPPITQVDARLVNLDPAFTMPVSGIDPVGNKKAIAVAPSGGLVPADGTTFTGSRQGASVGPILVVDTTGYGSIVLQLAGTFTGTVTFQVSNDLTTWSSAIAWPVAGSSGAVTTATAVGQWVIPAVGRYFRAQITTAGTGIPVAIAVLKNAAAPQFATTPTVTSNLSSVGGTATVTAGVAGIQAIGGNIAVGAAPTANPVPVGGWDGTNTRRILTDAVSGGVALGAAGVSNGASVSTLISAATNNLTQLKATLGKIHIIDIQNTNAAIRYLKLFNVPSASVTMGTTSATMNFAIPASGKLQIVTDLGLNMGGSGMAFALVTGSSLTDNTAVGAGDCICNFMWV